MVSGKQNNALLHTVALKLLGGGFLYIKVNITIGNHCIIKIMCTKARHTRKRHFWDKFQFLFILSGQNYI